MFVLFGGINQRKFVYAVKGIGETISGVVGRIINPTAFELTEDGVYINKEQLGENISDTTDVFNNSQTQEDSSNKEGNE